MFLPSSWRWRTTLDCEMPISPNATCRILPTSWRWWTTLDSNMPSSSDTLHVLLIRFAEFVKMTNHTRLWDADLSWYPPNTTRRILPRSWRWRTKLDCVMPSSPVPSDCYLPICLIRLEHGVGSRGPCNPNEISSTIWLLYCGSLFAQQISLVASLELWPSSNSCSISPRIRLRYTFVCAAFTRSEAMHNVSAHQLPRYYQLLRVPSIVWIVSVTWYTRRKLARTKILQNFWLILINQRWSVLVREEKITYSAVVQIFYLGDVVTGKVKDFKFRELSKKGRKTFKTTDKTGEKK